MSKRATLTNSAGKKMDNRDNTLVDTLVNLVNPLSTSSTTNKFCRRFSINISDEHTI